MIHPFRTAALLACLVASSLILSGYTFRCYILCEDQTAVQNDYIAARDRCREYAQLKHDMAMRNYKGKIDDKTSKSQLVSLFSECMYREGWTVPDGKDKSAAAAAPAAATPDPDAAKQAREKAFVQRSSECTFARSAAGNSSIAAARARACDLECEERLKAAPDAPRPAACTPLAKNKLSTGADDGSGDDQ